MERTDVCTRSLYRYDIAWPDQQIKDLIIRAEYFSRGQTCLVMLEVPYSVIAEHLIVYLSIYYQIVEVSSFYARGEWWFNFMLYHESFNFINNSLNRKEREYSLPFTSSKPTCSKHLLVTYVAYQALPRTPRIV